MNAYEFIRLNKNTLYLYVKYGNKDVNREFKCFSSHYEGTSFINRIYAT